VLGGALPSTLRGRLVPRLLRHHLLAIFLPLLAAAPVVPVVVVVRTWLGVPLFAGT